MNLRTIGRISAALGVLCAAVAGALTFAAPSSALEQPRITAVPDQVIKKDYGQLIGANQSALLSPSLLINYDQCKTDPACDVIPLTVPEPPTDDDFFLTITLEWDTQEVKQVPLEGDVAANDMDLWITNDPVVENAGPDEDGFAYKSAGVSEPEFVRMFSPVGNWHIFVVNASGVNTGYRLTLDWGTDQLSPVFESLPPEFSPPAARPKAQSTAPAAPAPSFEEAAPAPIAEPAPEPVAVKPNLALATPPAADAAFSAAPPTDLEDELAAPPAKELGVPAAAVKPADPSAAALLLWLLALPLLIVAGGAFVLSRRQASLLRM